MAKSKFGENTDPLVGKQTQFPHNDPTKGGRKPSIRKQLETLLEKEGKITIPSKQVNEIKDDGSVTITLPTQMQMAMKLASWAMSGKGNDSLKAIQMFMEQIDGKPKQEIEQKTTHEFEGDPFAKIRENAGVKAAPEKPKE